MSGRMMAKKTPSLRETSGAPFRYEDKVAAHYLIRMLAGGQLRELEHGTIVRMDWQVRESGRLLDDLLITFVCDNQERFLAVSVKSNIQVTPDGFPKDFVHLAWEQWLGETSEPFEKDRDLLGLATPYIDPSVKKAWDEMLGEARVTDPARFLKRVSTPDQTSKLKRRLFTSLQCPADLHHPEATDDLATVELLKHIRVLHLAYDDEETSISICQEMLRSGDPSKAGDMWDYIEKSIAKEHREGGGTIHLEKLIGVLSNRYNLKEYPYYRRDWDQIHPRSQEEMKDVQDYVGRKGMTLPRQGLLDGLRERVERCRLVALIGESGCGKSSLAKRFAKDPANFDTVVWMNGAVLDRDSLMSVQSDLGLQHSLSDIMRAAAAPNAVLVLDAVDRFPDRALVNARKLLRDLGLVEQNNKWRVILTSQGEGWTHAAHELSVSRIPTELFGKVEVEVPSLKEVNSLISAFRGLQTLVLKDEFKEVMRNLKVLDWIVSYSGCDPLSDLPRLTCLTELVDWVWERWIGETGDECSRAKLLKRMGEYEASSLTVGVGISKLKPESRTLKGLKDSGLIRAKDERVHLSHELTGDWARLRILIEECHHSTQALLRRAGLPRWHRAIRLYGQRVLEQDGLQEWRNLLLNFAGDSDDQGLVRNILLESAICATGREDALKHLWGDLSADNGHLLTRLLRQFLHIGTVAHPIAKQIGHDQREVRELGMVIRIPYGPYWQRMLELLYQHKDGIPSASQYAASEICGLWLETKPVMDESGRPFPLRRETAETALVIAHKVQKRRYARAHLEDEQAEVTYRSALHAAPELPEEVSQLALELCGRRPPTDDPQATDGDRGGTRSPEDKSGAGVRDSDELVPRPQGWPAREPLREPWPDGPSRRVDEAFRTACLSSQALSQLIRIKPKVACEVVLALCIEAPKPQGHSDYPMDMSFGTERVRALSPPMFFRGPFLQLLKTSPEVGLDLIIRLVNFATERWVACVRDYKTQHAHQEDDDTRPASLYLDGRVISLHGDWRVYSWHRNVLIDAETVVSSLMALEKWLYDELEAKHKIDRWIEIILKRSRSAAFVGVLAAVGKREPSLLEGPLLPILGISRAYDWDVRFILEGADVWRIEMLQWQHLGNRLCDTVSDWHSLAHRTMRLDELAMTLLLGSASVAEFFATIRGRWAEERDDSDDPESLDCLIARFDPANYTMKQLPNGRSIAELQWPENLRGLIEASAGRSASELEFAAFPITCRKLLQSRVPLEREQLDGFWAQLRRLADSDCAPRPPMRKQDAICGGIAVLLTMHRDWLTSHAEREKWCVDKLVSVASSPPKAGQYEFPDTISHQHWECFLGECSIALLSENPEEETFRRLVANSVTGFLYLTTGLTMRAAYRMRDRLKDDFIRMQNLAVKWAAVRCVDMHAQGLRVDLRECAEKSRAALVEQFVSRRIESTLSSWEPARTRAREQLDRLQKRARRKVESAGLDLEVLKSAFDWIPSLDEARAEERESWIAIHRELRDVVLAEVANHRIDPFTKILEGHPSEFDMWVFGQIAQLVCPLEAEQAEPLWRPILDLAPKAHRWIEEFLTWWQLCGTRAARSPELFVERWRPMIEYAFESWGRANSPDSQPGDVWNALMGLERHYDVLSGEEFAKPLASLLLFFKQWAESSLWNAWNSVTFAAFLSQPGASKLVCSGLQWVRDAVVGYDEDKWRHCDRLESSIASLLWECWEKHRPELQSDEGFRGAFLYLLAVLVGRQNPSALRLKDEVGSSLAR